jgi:2-polyprenyl-3-methyl-5-hydroxy-6-metoxy-1,4-benzoquinol methylase
MVHEVRQPEHFLRQIYEILKPAGTFLLVEPIIHVSEKAFEQTVSLSKGIGFRIVEQPQVRASRAVLLGKQGG